MEREGVVRDFQVQFRRQDGTIIWVNESARAVKDEQGLVRYYEGSLEEITARKQAEARLEGTGSTSRSWCKNARPSSVQARNGIAPC